MPSATSKAVTRQLSSLIDRLVETLTDLDTEQLYGEDELWRALQDLVRLAIAKLREADRRVSL